MEHEFIMSPEQEFDLAKTEFRPSILPKSIYFPKMGIGQITGSSWSQALKKPVSPTLPENDIHQLLNNVKSMNITPMKIK